MKPRRTAPMDPRVHAAVRLRSREPIAKLTAAVHRAAARQPSERSALDAAALESTFGPPPRALRRVERELQRHGIEVVEAFPATSLLHVTAPRETLSEAFGGGHDGALARRSHRCPLTGSTAGLIADLLLNEAPLFHGRLRNAHFEHSGGIGARPLLLGERCAEPAAIASAYDFPPAVPGVRPRLGVILLGGGFHESDLEQGLRRQGLEMPELEVLTVGGVENDPSPPDTLREFIDYLERALQLPPTAPSEPFPFPDQIGQLLWTMEATTDLQLLGSFVNEARITAVMAPDTGWGQAVAFSRLIALAEPPSAISVSWGTSESDVPAAGLRTLDFLFKLAALRGVSICCSSGDKGALCGPDLERPAHFPASSPHVLACGGTKLDLTGPEAKEQVWNETRGGSVLATGGGFSHAFRRPIWQQHALAGVGVVTRRAFPDVAAKADYATGYPIVLGGEAAPIGGTSSAAPLWASLIARLGAHLGRPLGLVTPLLYSSAFAGALRCITVGNNCHFQASPGWDACTGLGSPKGKGLLECLRRAG